MAALMIRRSVARAAARASGVLLAKARKPPTRAIHTLPTGTFPVMLTPFHKDKSIDWEALDGSINHT